MERLRRKMVTLLMCLLYLGHSGLWLGLGVQGEFLIPGLPKKSFKRLADINFGVLAPRMFAINPCTTHFFSRRTPEVVAYVVKRINKHHALPKNLKLGFVIKDICTSKRFTTAFALSFVPQTRCSGTSDEDSLTPHDVVAAIGAGYSSLSMMAANILAPSHVPLISVFSTSDDLSDTHRFPYFVRVVPPDRFQFQVIAELIFMYNWTYVSVVYSPSMYGENGFKQLSILLKDSNVCMAVVRSCCGTSSEEVDSVAKELVEEYRRARVVVAIMVTNRVHLLIAATGRFLSHGSFIWIGTDGWSGSEGLDDVHHLLLDSLLVDVHTAFMDDFDDWFEKHTPNETSSPWLRDQWEKHVNCSFEKGSCDNTKTVRDTNFTKNYRDPKLGYIADAVYLIANATARVLQSANCSHVSRSDARNCVTGPRLLHELKTTRLNGYSGFVELDSNGDRLMHYDVWQMRARSSREYHRVKVFEFDSVTGRMPFNPVSWTNDNVWPGFQHPQSRCSLPCGPHAARIVRKVSCCWICKPCDQDQRLTRNGTRCERCPKFTSPDPDSAFTECRPMHRKIYGASTGQIVFHSFVILLGLSVSLVAGYFFYCYPQCHFLSATTRELSYLTLAAIISGYLSIVIFLNPPSEVICKLQYVLVSLSITMVNVSMLLRAFHVFRVFRTGNVTEVPPGRQLTLAILLMSVQAVMCALVISQYDRWHKLSQLSPTMRHVESTCAWHVIGLASFLAYNLLLLVVSTALTLRPQQILKEGDSIFMCACTSLIVALCFIPAYLVAERELHRTMMLVVLLVLSHCGALAYLFLPKVYTVWKGLGAKEDKGVTTTSETMDTK
ncbi:metabotropic glutamate receptor 6-like [Babylonia areolata]|uniref:metabotropic glutamate receptor 6-like n=1 Tax=Babylonia areolata TaxID=304850 RepID=UPI003FD2C387